MTNQTRTDLWLPSQDMGSDNETPFAFPALPDQATKTEAPFLSNDDLLTSKIVVVDDDSATTRLIGSILENDGFECVQTFNQAPRAIEYLNNFRPDLILLDVRMPEIDGIRMLKYLRSQDQTQFIPIIVLTSDCDDQTRLNALNAGANDFVTKPVNRQELIARVRNSISFRRHTDRIEKQIQSVTHELDLDPLTGLNNRRGFENRFNKLFSSERTKSPSLILLDIDFFKQANDRWGHLAGDQVLNDIGRIIKQCCDQGEFAARIGGDEFAIIGHHANVDQSFRLARKISGKISRKPTEYDGKKIRSTVSVGVARASAEINDNSKLFKCADAALYQSKHQGRNTINIFSEATSLAQKNDLLQSVSDGADLANVIGETKSAKIFVVDDESVVTDSIQSQLNKSGYVNVQVENDATLALEKIRSMQPDLVLLDVRMPGCDGLEILRQLRENAGVWTTPVLVLTTPDDDSIRIAALKLQANDFLSKPIKPDELETRVHNSLLVKFQQRHLKAFTNRLSLEVDIRTSELFATRRETILCMARAAESRDAETGNHVIRVGYYAAVIARKMGLDEDQVGWIELAAQLHDVGKLSIPDAILLKPGKLDDEERKIIETHCNNADQIFFGKAAIPGQTVITSPLLKMAAVIASTHHEHWDGTGYPRKLSGEDIPIEGRITAVADVFDALSSPRAYKVAYSIEKCIDIISQGRGTHFDPQVVDAFLDGLDEILIVMNQWQDLHLVQG